MSVNTHIVISLTEYHRLQVCKEELKSLRQKYDILKAKSIITNDKALHGAGTNDEALLGAGPSDLNITVPFEVPVENSVPTDAPPILKSVPSLPNDDSEEEESAETKEKKQNSKKEVKLGDISKLPWYYLGPPSP